MDTVLQVSRAALANGADYLAVARISEAVCLRQAGIEAPMLLFGYAAPEYAAGSQRRPGR